MENWCIHFTGVQNDVCEAGVKYQSVKNPEGGLETRFPCVNPAVKGLCSSHELHTAEEIAAHEKSIADFIAKLGAFESRSSEDCPHCGQHVTGLKQVGRCVYARPCGCRLWQGRIPAAWDTSR